MNDELPTEERLGRIERGVRRRIDARRAARQGVLRGVVGVAVAAVVIGGGFALLRPQSNSGGGSTAAGGTAAGSAASAAPSTTVPVRCHGDRTVVAQADPAGLPASALAACVAAERRANVSAQQNEGTAASATPATSTLCRTKGGVLHVYAGPPAVCATHGLSPYPR